ncbi:ABC transporter permease [Pseudooceanicola spongiae]|uniref:ABC transporter permease subunit n=1 Tax=Pseudooceanicola spongiae TaxID=2613965 RepID=A0A7L9WL49_9RHOB|nr:ABC transporter permease [Pseudooceanicola spongiae]QOL81125.1 ABC transporter permease subunit [Pseudooceanicola spongiae]
MSDITSAPLNAPTPVSPGRQAWAMFRQNHAAVFGLAILGLIFTVSLFGPLLYTVSPREMVWMPLTPPGQSEYLLGLVSWTSTARLTRAEFMRLREMDYVKAERSIGAGNARLIWRVILPNAAPPLIVVAALSIGSAILFEAGLSFLGLSDPNATSWGRMIGDNRPYILDSSWGVTFPGLCIFLTVLAISLVGDGLNDAFNPRLRQR